MAEDWDLAWAGTHARRLAARRCRRFEAGEELATRAAGQKVMAAFAEFAPTMIGGAADLVESTKTIFEGAGEFSRVHAGRNIPFGIREHAMGAIVNGAAAHGGIVKPYGSTFLIFSDYMRGAVRLSALMGLPVVWVWTHDSVGLGEDGPTHQPIEHYASLRAIPAPVGDPPGRRQRDLRRLAGRARARGRPGRAAALAPERRGARPHAGRRRGASSSAAATCCGTRPPDGDASPELDPDRDRRRGRRRRSRPRRTLAGEGARVRVVSMPCMELFEAQTQEYREQVLPRACTARLAVEPGATHQLVEVGRQRRRRARARPLRSLGAGYHRAEELGFDADGTSPRARRHCSIRRP